MSKGSKIVPLRIDGDLLNEIEQSVGSANYYTKGEPYTTSSWIRQCIKEKLDKLRRGSSKGKRKKANPEQTTKTESEN